MKKITIYSLAIIGLSLVFMAATKKNAPIVSLKNIDKTMVKVDSNLYAAIYETTNFQYREFLNELKKEKKFKSLEIAQIDSANWVLKNNYMEPFMDYYHIHPAYDNYPVVNISYEAAKLYCHWLSQKYNNNPHRKFNKVLIRLPSKEEWQKAAIGTMQQAPYPWGGPYVTDNCNFHKIHQASIHWDKEKEEYVLPKHASNMGVANNLNENTTGTMLVNSFEPNSIGLYNMSGNAAEMIQEKGIACGGGWRSAGYDVQITSSEKYEHSDIDLGFRYFMEIIKE